MAQQQQTRAITVAGKAQQALDEAQLDPRLLMAAKAMQLMAGQDKDGNPNITGDMAIAAALYQAGTGQMLGRDFYVNEKVGRMEGYRGVARDANERGVGEVQIKYRPLAAEEAEDHEIQAGDTAVACEVYQLRAWNMAQRMGQRYEPIVGIGIIRKVEKYDKKSTQRWDDNQRRYVQLPESNWRQATLEGGMTWRKKAQNRAYKDALRHTPGMPASPEEVIADAAANLDELPPEAARLTMEQAQAWVEQHGISGDGEPDGIMEGEYVEPPKPTSGNSDKGVTIDGSPTEPAYKRLPRPWPANVAVEAIRDMAAVTKNELPDNGAWKALIGHLDSAPFDTAKRHALMREVFGVDSSKALNGHQRYALNAWAKPGQVDGKWQLDGRAIAEYTAIVNPNRISDDALDGVIWPRLVVGASDGEEYDEPSF
jgi:hypothetical protein